MSNLWGDTAGAVKGRYTLWGIALLSSLYLLQSCSPQHRLPRQQRAQGIYHIVKPRENLFRIGKAYDIDYKVLARINGIRRPNRVLAGQRLFIPGATRQLPVEIITPSESTLKRPPPAGPGQKGSIHYLWPVRGRITSRFGPRGRTFHDGIDIAAPAGTRIRAIAAGKVIFSDKLRGYGNIVIVQHPHRVVSVYAHNRRNLAREGQRVRRGEVIAQVGSTGRVTGPHLHFEIRKNNTAADPLYYLPKL